MLKQILLIISLGFCLSGAVMAADKNALVGGYQKISVDNSQVQAAAKFAADQVKGKLITILAAQSQVVAGVNYKLLVEIKATDGAHHIYNMLVFVPLPINKQPMQLTKSKDLGSIDSLDD